MSFNLAHLAIVHAGVTFALAGLIWAVQLAIYPLFSSVGSERFVEFHRRYMRGITAIVGPLTALELLTAALLAAQGVRGPLFLGSLVLIGMIWAITLVVELPLQRRLGQGFDAETHRLLVLTNWTRTLGWTARAAMIGAWLFTLTGF